MSVLQTPIFQIFRDPAAKLHVDLLLQLVGPRIRSREGTGWCQEARREDYASVGVSSFSNNHLLFLKVCNFLVIRNAISMQE